MHRTICTNRSELHHDPTLARVQRDRKPRLEPLDRVVDPYLRREKRSTGGFDPSIRLGKSEMFVYVYFVICSSRMIGCSHNIGDICLYVIDSWSGPHTFPTVWSLFRFNACLKCSTRFGRKQSCMTIDSDSALFRNAISRLWLSSSWNDRLWA